MGKSFALLLGLFFASSLGFSQENSTIKDLLAQQSQNQAEFQNSVASSATTAEPLSDATSIGGDHSGGGSFTPADFMNKTRLFLKFLRKKGSVKVQLEFAGTEAEITYQQMLKIYRRGIKVVPGDEGELYVNGRRVEFKNTPRTNEIATDDAWSQQASEVLKLQITIHELLGLAMVDDPSYELSERLTELTQEWSQAAAAAQQQESQVASQVPAYVLTIERTEVIAGFDYLYFKGVKKKSLVRCGGSFFRGARGSTLAIYMEQNDDRNLSRAYDTEAECLLAKHYLMNGAKRVAIMIDKATGLPQLEIQGP